MCMTYYTVDDLRPGRHGWDVRQFSALAEALDHYRALPMNGGRVLGMADAAHAFSPATPRVRTFWRQITGAAA